MKTLFSKVLERNFEAASVASVKQAVERALGPIPFINWKMDSSWAVIRARSIDPEKEDISLPSTFGSPPAKYTSIGRANLANQPVFYGSFDGRTAMQETKVSVNTECYVSIWEFLKPPVELTTFLNGADSRNDLHQLNNLLPKQLPAGLTGGYTKKSLETAFDLRASAFVKENYAFTARLAHDVIYNNAALTNGLVYPSVVDPYRCNIALNPDFVESSMNVVRIYKMVWSGAFIFRQLARGTPENDFVKWEETGTYERDELDLKYSGSKGPNEIHPSALKVLDEKKAS